MIHPCITRYGKKETKNYLKYLGDDKITGTVTPPHVSLAYHSFEHLMDIVEPHVPSSTITDNFFRFTKKIRGIIRTKKMKNPLDKEAVKMVEKIVKKEKSKLGKKILELQKEIKRSKSRRSKAKTRKSKDKSRRNTKSKKRTLKK